MKELTEIATRYAEEKTNEVMINAIAKAYADGYRDGYKDREEEIPIDLRSNETEYVDLGLPSGTLWSTDYETIDGNVLNLTHEEASNYDIPSEEQWKELTSWCKWSCGCSRSSYWFDCLGPNGNKISFSAKRRWTPQLGDACVLKLWLIDKNSRAEKNAAYVFAVKDNLNQYNIMKKELQREFSGVRLSLRLVRTK